MGETTNSQGEQCDHHIKTICKMMLESLIMRIRHTNNLWFRANKQP